MSSTVIQPGYNRLFSAPRLRRVTNGTLLLPRTITDRRFGVCVRWSRQLACEQPDLPVLGVRTPLGAIDSRFVLASRGRCADAAVGPSRHEPYVACLTRGVCPGAGIVWRPAMRRRGRRSAVRRRSPWRAFAFGAMLASWLRRVPAMSAVPDVYEHAARVRVNLAAGWQA